MRVCIPFALALLAARGLAEPAPLNLAPYATPATSFVSGHETLGAINDGAEPRHVGDNEHGAYGNWPKTGTQWVELRWSRPIKTREVAVYWWDDRQGVRLPVACRLSYKKDGRLVPVEQAAGLGVAGGQWNVTTFDPVETTVLRLEFDGQPTFSTGILEWKVLDAGGSVTFPPQVEAGVDRVVVRPAKTWLKAAVKGRSDGRSWSKVEGPGDVTFDHADEVETEAAFTQPGDYVLRFAARHGDQEAADTLRVQVLDAPARAGWGEVAMRPYTVDSAFWRPRLRNQILHWIPHCIAKLSEPGLKEGGIGNFIEAGNKLAGRPFKPHSGAPWANAYTFNTLEAMCLALQLEPGIDTELQAGQAALRAKLEEWIPLVLAAQEPDGYLQTRFTLGTAGEIKQGKAPPRWTIVGDHEGYIAGYFLDAAVAHYRLTEGRDRRMYDAARKLADCWDRHVGPSSEKKWYDGHQAIEMALVRLAELTDEVEGAGAGTKYVRLARHLLDNRGGGGSYDQAHLPVTRQYEALGHAVRAVYNYNAMADIARHTGDAGYQSAVLSLWDNITHAKYYLTGGIGSGETSEGFGANFSLRNTSYCESCSNCGLLFFNHRLHRDFGQARYADVVEDALYNAVLGSVDVEGRNFTYVNPLDQDHARYPWHDCPCCIGNIPRTLLSLPTWMYAPTPDGLAVNLYLGSRVQVGPVAGAALEVEQRTGYPWQGGVEIVLHLKQKAVFALRLREPGRTPSALYRAEPAAGELAGLKVNGKAAPAKRVGGYVVIDRKWRDGDVVSFEVPLPVQRVTCDTRVGANRGRVALRRGPLVYNLEAVDQPLDKVLDATKPLEAVWEPDLLGGVMVVQGAFTDGTPLRAIPNYARNNRGGRSIVWFKDAAP